MARGGSHSVYGPRLDTHPHRPRRALVLVSWPGWVAAGEGVGAAQGIRQPVAASHVADHVRGVVAGHPAAVTNSGRVESSPRSTGTAWVAVRNAVLATPITGTPNSA